MSERGDLELYFGEHLIGTVSDIGYEQISEYGTFRPADHIPLEIREFISLCLHWHSRIEAGQFDHDEMSAWWELYNTGEWRMVAPDGSVTRIYPPTFLGNGTVHWNEA